MVAPAVPCSLSEMTVSWTQFNVVLNVKYDTSVVGLGFIPDFPVVTLHLPVAPSFLHTYPRLPVHFHSAAVLESSACNFF